MRFLPSVLAAFAVVCIPRVAAVAPTDSYRDADAAQSGYLPNHNMDPAVVDSSQFGQLWKVPFNAQEQVSMLPVLFHELVRPCLTASRARKGGIIKTLEVVLCSCLHGLYVVLTDVYARIPGMGLLIQPWSVH